MENLHPIQKEVLKIYKTNGKLPTFRKLAEILNVASLNTVSYHVKQLKKNGHLGLADFENGLIRLNLKNILDFESKPGVFVLLLGKKPFYVAESGNIKNHLLEKIAQNDSPLLKKIKNETEKIHIAYYLIPDSQEREELKNHLTEYYSRQNETLLQ
jgi:DNA-binding Lrp family transcriptional regulator